MEGKAGIFREPTVPSISVGIKIHPLPVPTRERGSNVIGLTASWVRRVKRTGDPGEPRAEEGELQSRFNVIPRTQEPCFPAHHHPSQGLGGARALHRRERTSSRGGEGERMAEADQKATEGSVRAVTWGVGTGLGQGWAGVQSSLQLLPCPAGLCLGRAGDHCIPKLPAGALAPERGSEPTIRGSRQVLRKQWVA